MRISINRFFTARNSLFLFLLLSSLIGLVFFLKRQSLTDYVERYEKKLHVLEQEAMAGLDKLYWNFQADERTKAASSELGESGSLFRERGIVYLVYENDSLVFWSDYSPAVENYRKEVCLDNSIARLRNGWYEVIEHPQSNKNKRHFIALILLKRDFGYQNKYLQSGFPDFYSLPKNAELSDNITGANTVKNHLGRPLFEMKVSDENGNFIENNNWLLLLFFLLYVLVIIFLYTISFTRGLGGFETNGRLAIFIGMVVVLRVLMIVTGLPFSLFSNSLFDAAVYGNAASFLFPYLGDLFMNVLFLFVLSLLFNKHFVFPKKNRKLMEVVLGTGLAAVTLCLNFVIQTLVQNSHLSFRLNDFFSLGEWSYVSVVAVAVIFISLYNYTSKIFDIPDSEKDFSLVSLFSITLLLHFFGSQFVLHSGLFAALWPIMYLGLLYFLNQQKMSSPFSNLLPIVICSSLIAAYLFNNQEEKKELDYRKVYAENLASQQDDVAENLFVDVAKKMTSDPQLKKLIYTSPVNAIDLEQRIRQVYLSGYWEKFNVIISVTDSACNPLLKTENPIHSNNAYFDEQIESCGIPTVCNGFYFVDHAGSRQRYVARIPVFPKEKPDRKPSAVYIQLESKLNFDGTGFPELLLDHRVKTNRQLKEYSYAVYKDGNLLSRSGKFNYTDNIFWDKGKAKEFNEIIFRDFHHLLYISEGMATAVSIPVETLTSRFTLYTSYFAFFSLVLIGYLLVSAVFNDRKIVPQALSYRVQFLLVVAVFISLLSFGAGTFFVVRQQFETQNREALLQRSRLFLNELQNKLGESDDLKDSYREYSAYTLKKMSGLFQSDVSLFDFRGNLFASSQPRLFEEGIVSKKMNPQALRQLLGGENNNLVLKERIGNLEYYSSYQPFINKNGKLLGFLNLPYFAKQDELEKEITLYISALTNIYVVLFVLSILTALFFSNLVTKPLRMLQERFSRMSLGRKNEPIHWKEKDEIGALVQEYNKMIEALELSAEKLARSERESAWREMAKQVAHEIKNPLTPMKLNIQHLQRTLAQTDADELRERVKKLAAMLIEQIDTLSSIATAFSVFAKMPHANIERINLIELASDAVQLFKEAENVKVVFESGLNDAFVKADKEQFHRIFNNLIKNAIQSIPDQREGLVIVSVSKFSGKILIRFRDNGTGIPEEIIDKIFQPNFSTKSEGMGLGLAIVKNIVESFGGTITFETVQGEGSVFEIALSEADL